MAKMIPSRLDLAITQEVQSRRGRSKAALQLIRRQRLQRADPCSQQYRKSNQTAAAGNTVQRSGNKPVRKSRPSSSSDKDSMEIQFKGERGKGKGKLMTKDKGLRTKVFLKLEP